MSDRYFGRVVDILDRFTVVMNKGSEQGVRNGAKFLVAGIGSVIIDPDTHEELENLEIVKGCVEVTHTQPKIATLSSCVYNKSLDVREIRKVISKGSLFAALGSGQETVTEVTTPGERTLKELDSVQMGDVFIKL